MGPKKKKPSSRVSPAVSDEEEVVEAVPQVPPMEAGERPEQYLVRCYMVEGRWMHEYEFYCTFCREFFLTSPSHAAHYQRDYHYENQEKYEKAYGKVPIDPKTGKPKRNIHSLSRKLGRVERELRIALEQFFNPSKKHKGTASGKQKVILVLTVIRIL